MEDLKICPKPSKYRQFLFCEAVKVGMANSKETSFSNTQALFLSSLWFLKIHLKPSTYTRNAVMKNRTLNHPSHY
jgi:hypothetical protein